MLTSGDQVPLQPSRRPASLLLLALLATSVFALILARSRPLLFINLGPGDEPFARGFRGGWERDGPRGEGDTPFRWTEDGARLVVPLQVKGSLQARLRVARFTRTPAEITVVGNGVALATWTQHPLGWRIRTIELGEWDGPLTLQFRSKAPEEDPLGIALDWVEIVGVEHAWPDAGATLRLLLLLAGAPLVIWTFTASVGRAALFGAWGAAIAMVTVQLDRLGGQAALTAGAVPVLIALAAIGAVGTALQRAFPRHFNHRAFFVPWAAAMVALIALLHPFCYYADVDTHAKLVDALDERPSLALDPRPYQASTGAWTRTIAGERVPFPYSPAFHVLAWPLARLVGPVAAVKTVAVTAVGLTLLLAFALARAVGLSRGTAVLVQAVVCLLPVTASRLTLALYPALLAQALELALLLVLMRLLPVDDARHAAILGLMAAGVLAAYTGSLLGVAVVVVCVAGSELLARRPASALRLLAATSLAAALVIAIQYRHFLPVLWHDVLPHAGAGSPEDDGVPGPVAALRRLAIFFDHVHPGLALLGVLALHGATTARRVWRLALLAGLLLLVLRYALPALFRDAKEMELLAAPVAAAMVAGWAWLWKRPWGRPLAVGSGAWVLLWGAWRAAALYAERFTALGR